MIIERTCTEIQNGSQEAGRTSVLLKNYRDTPAYVLLGDPGDGKTTAFKFEQEAIGDGAVYITARDFLTFAENCPAWREKTLFIDGLDEIRAGSADPRTPFDQVRRQLAKLDVQRFRLSCRMADWLGENDREHLSRVLPDSKVTTLRLNPLTDSDIASILANHRDLRDPEAFVREAKCRHIDGLLANPQNLQLLASVVGKDEVWPESRLELFTKACRQMAREHNKEHRIPRVPTISEDQLIDSIGRLCAVQLISGSVGWSLRDDESDDSFPTLAPFGTDELPALRHGLTTKLFTGPSASRLVPVHRHIAEFLAASHLARLIREDRLHPTRVTALIAGADGGIVSPLRGLSAWLATHCEQARSLLTRADPIGVGMYGDIGEYSDTQKLELLRSLKHEWLHLRLDLETAIAFAPLATPALESQIRKILTEERRDRDHQVFVAFLLCILAHGTRLPGLTGVLAEIARDSTYDYRQWALDAFVHNSLTDLDPTPTLKQILADTQPGRFSDPYKYKELVGILLSHLYPQEVSPPQIWDYLTDGNAIQFGRYWNFWSTKLLELSQDSHVIELLDEFVKLRPQLRLRLERIFVGKPLLKLLIWGLKIHGKSLSAAQLCNWLALAALPNAKRYWHTSVEADCIRKWLEKNAECREKVLSESLKDLNVSIEFGQTRSFSSIVQNHLCGGSLPESFGLWCLDQAVEIGDSNPAMAKTLFSEAWHAYQLKDHDRDLSIDVLQERTKNCSILYDAMLRASSQVPVADTGSGQIGHAPSYINAKKLADARWMNELRSNVHAISKNQGDPAILQVIARSYFGLHDTGSTGVKSVSKLCHGERNLAGSAMNGIRNAIHRSDLPSVEEVFQLKGSQMIHPIGLPFLAGLEELVLATNSRFPSDWRDDDIRTALAFFFVESSLPKMPVSIKLIIKERLDLAADLFMECSKAGVSLDYGIRSLFWINVDSIDHKRIVRNSSLRLLKSYPIRCNKEKIDLFDRLLWVALNHSEESSLRKLTEVKLSKKSMNIGQRVRWMTVCTFLSPEEYEDSFLDFLEGHESRIRSLIQFLCPSLRYGQTLRYLDSVCDERKVLLIGLLVRLLGKHLQPIGGRWQVGGKVSLETEGSLMIDHLIQTLGAEASLIAKGIFESLCVDSSLKGWREKLSMYQARQNIIWRDSSYRHPAIDEVCQSLKSGLPANVADLAAITIQKLQHIAERIRTSNTDDWKQYWNEWPSGKICKPKHENSCRDALLSDLRQSIGRDIDAQPEGEYANDARADIRVSYKEFQIPIEIKKSTHRELWSGIRNQLIKKYAVDPATGGYGIYLVFWFGVDPAAQPHPAAGHPDNPERMRELLETSLSASERRKISICVIDVSPPHPAESQ